MHAKTPSTKCTYCVGLREQWNARTAVDSGETPWHFTARRTKFAEVQMDDHKKISWARKSQQRRVMGPLREGREIWGVDGAFASMSWRRHCVRDGVAPPANELAWFYMGSDIGRAVGVPDAVNAALSSPMKMNIIFCSLFTNRLRPFRDFIHHTVTSINRPSSSHQRHEMFHACIDFCTVINNVTLQMCFCIILHYL